MKTYRLAELENAVERYCDAYEELEAYKKSFLLSQDRMDNLSRQLTSAGEYLCKVYEESK